MFLKPGENQTGKNIARKRLLVSNEKSLTSISSSPTAAAKTLHSLRNSNTLNENFDGGMVTHELPH